MYPDSYNLTPACAACSNHVFTTVNVIMASKTGNNLHEEIYKYLVECSFSRAAKWFLRESGVVSNFKHFFSPVQFWVIISRFEVS